jgi:hypothetical protein
MRHKTKDKGDLAVAKTIAHVLEHDIRCCLPLSEHLPFDLIAVMPDMRTLRRVQVKYRAMRFGAVEFAFRGNYYNSKQIYSVPVNLENIDVYALYCPDTSKVYYLRVNEIPADALTMMLRIESPKNGQMKRVWWAKDFLDPYRIAPFGQITLALRRKVEDKDEVAIAKVIVDLTAQGIQPCIPQSQYTPFDLVAVMPDMMTMYRLRVGYGSVLREEEADYYAIYEPDSGQIHYVSKATVPPHIDMISADSSLNTVTHLNGAFAG